jgi:DNA-directed RNA polymerase specialized sigma24 family protein
MSTATVKRIEDIRNQAVDLYRLAMLLTGRQDSSIEIAADTAVSGDEESGFFTNWMRSWQRRLVIGRALAEIRDELADSARRTQLLGVEEGAMPRGNWSLSADTTQAELDSALLEIDLFPRVALLLLIFEGIPMAEAATLLDAAPALIRKAQAIGLIELTANLAGKKSAVTKRQSPAKVCHWLRIVAFCH